MSDTPGRASSVDAPLSSVQSRRRSGPARRGIAGRSAAIVGLAVELTPDAAVVVGPDGRIRLTNRQTEALFGYAREELVGQPLEALIPERFHHAHRRHRTDYLAAPRMRPMGASLELFGRRKDGGEFPVAVSLRPLDEDGELLVLASIRDISDVRRAQAAREAAESATDELRRLQSITDMALAHRSLDDLLPALLDRIRAVMAVDNAAILLPDRADGDVLCVRAVSGPEEAAVTEVRVPVGRGFAGRIAARRAPLVVDDLATFDAVSPFLRERLRSAAGVPLLVEDRLVGVAHIGSVSPRHFTEREVRLLQLVAERIALAIDHAQLHDAELVAQTRARVSEAAFGRLVEANIIGVVVANESLLAANDAFLHLVGYTREELRARGVPAWRALTAPEYAGETRRASVELQTTGACAPFETEFVRRDGGRVPALVGAALLERAPPREVAFVVDLTERKWLERQREEARAAELATREVARHLDQFFATAAHDIRNPVTIVKGNVQLALDWYERLEANLALAAGAGRQSKRAASGLEVLKDALREALREADAAADRLTRLVALLFDVARARTGQLEVRPAPCDLIALVREQVGAQRISAPGRAISLELPADSATVPVLADADQIGRVIANYVTNALKYSAADRPVEVRLEVVVGLAVVSVRDEGPGLPLLEQVHVWEPFHRAPGVEAGSGSPESLGLGLHICRRIVELHPGGRLGVESELGQGATFWFRLPLATGPTELARRAP